MPANALSVVSYQILIIPDDNQTPHHCPTNGLANEIHECNLLNSSKIWDIDRTTDEVVDQSPHDNLDEET